MFLETKKAASSWHVRTLGLGLAHQAGHTYLELGRLDGHRQPGVEARGRPLVDVAGTGQVCLRSTVPTTDWKAASTCCWTALKPITIFEISR